MSGKPEVWEFDKLLAMNGGHAKEFEGGRVLAVQGLGGTLGMTLFTRNNLKKELRASTGIELAVEEALWLFDIMQKEHG